MKKLTQYLILIVTLLVSLTTLGQDTQDNEEKIEALRIAYITKRLELTPKEAEVFWPVYNQYTDRLKALRNERKSNYLKSKDKFDQMSEKELEDMINGEMTFRDNEVKIMKELNEELKKVLPIKKIAKLYIAEETFKRQLIKKLLENKKQ